MPRLQMHRSAAGVPLAALVALLAASLPALAGPAAIELALLPTLSVRALFDVYRPLREFLEREAMCPVRLVTAPDYRTLVTRTQHREYRYVVTAPHFARLAQLEAGYVPLLRVQRDLSAVVVTARRDGVASLEALSGGDVATPDALAIVSMLGVRLLRAHGLEPGRDVAVVPYPSFASAVLAARNGEVAAAVSAETALGQMPSAIRESLTIIARSEVVPPVMLVARDDVPVEERELVTSLLLRFNEDNAGAAFFARTRFLGYRALLPGEMEGLDPYVEALRAVLARP